MNQNETFEQRAQREMLEEAGAKIGDRVRLLQTTPPGMDPDEDRLTDKVAKLVGVYVEMEDDGNGETGPRVHEYAALKAELEEPLVLHEDEDSALVQTTVHLHPGDFEVIKAVPFDGDEVGRELKRTAQRDAERAASRGREAAEMEANADVQRIREERRNAAGGGVLPPYGAELDQAEVDALNQTEGVRRGRGHGINE